MPQFSREKLDLLISALETHEKIEEQSIVMSAQLRVVFQGEGGENQAQTAVKKIRALRDKIAVLKAELIVLREAAAPDELSSVFGNFEEDVKDEQ